MREPRAANVSFCLRNVSRGEREQADDLHEAEARTILNSGLAPTKALGSTYGQNAATHVRQKIGFPPGVNAWLDLEGVKSSSSHATVIDYCNAWIRGRIPRICSRRLHRRQSHSRRRGNFLCGSACAVCHLDLRVSALPRCKLVA
jgi:Domain of unknown function (DUF1906)